ncbi:MAG: hypothetical protein RL522_141 [Pseudomonadota bacterium]|jgi:hypothetical protein
MSLNVSVWFVIVLALLAANLPFFSQRLLGLLPLKAPKSLAVRLAELVVMYFLAGGVGLLLEHRAGQIAPQGWEFYAITASLFVTLAFPGFVWRYLVNRPA